MSSILKHLQTVVAEPFKRFLIIGLMGLLVLVLIRERIERQQVAYIESNRLALHIMV